MKMERIKISQTKPDVSAGSYASETASHSNMLTIEELKSFSGCENIDYNESEEIIQSLY